MKNKRIAIFGGSFNPPGLNHLNVVKILEANFDEVWVVPCGRRIKNGVAVVSASERAEMILLTFSGLTKTVIDLSDIHNHEYTRTYNLDLRLQAQITGQIFHVVGSDLVQGGADGKSEIQISWYRGQELWTKLNYAVIQRAEYPITSADLPPNSYIVSAPELGGSSTLIRKNIEQGLSISGLVVPAVEKLIHDRGLYK